MDELAMSDAWRVKNVMPLQRLLASITPAIRCSQLPKSRELSPLPHPNPSIQLTYEPGYLPNILRKREHDLNNNHIHIMQYTMLDNMY